MERTSTMVVRWGDLFLNLHKIYARAERVWTDAEYPSGSKTVINFMRVSFSVRQRIMTTW